MALKFTSLNGLPQTAQRKSPVQSLKAGNAQIQSLKQKATRKQDQANKKNPVITDSNLIMLQYFRYRKEC
jgi:hypothetical protein